MGMVGVVILELDASKSIKCWFQKTTRTLKLH